MNYLWWAGKEAIIGQGMNMTDMYPGVLWGSAPSSWLPRNNSMANPLSSVVLIPEEGRHA